MIVIIDYGLGNLRSVQKALERINQKAIISSLSEDILGADKLILPGVGHFKQGIAHIQDNTLTKLLQNAVLIIKTPI
jgi:glutamine amidotransferase